MRIISFSHTTPQFRARTKDVTATEGLEEFEARGKTAGRCQSDGAAAGGKGRGPRDDRGYQRAEGTDRPHRRSRRGPRRFPRNVPARVRRDVLPDVPHEAAPTNHTDRVPQVD